jgi:hypothetical protein
MYLRCLFYFGPLDGLDLSLEKVMDRSFYLLDSLPMCPTSAPAPLDTIFFSSLSSSSLPYSSKQPWVISPPSQVRFHARNGEAEGGEARKSMGKTGGDFGVRLGFFVTTSRPSLVLGEKPRWCSYGSFLALWLDNCRKQVNAVPWSTRFHSLFELPPFNFRIHMS